MDGYVLSGHDNKILSNVKDAEQCKVACEEEKSFFCRSFDYYPAGSKCYLSITDRHVAAIAANVNFKYYERDCEGELHV